MRTKHIENIEQEHPHTTEASHSPAIESAILKLVVDSYIHGAQTCQLHDGKVLGVSIHQGEADNIHLFIDDCHKLTVEVKNGNSRLSILTNNQPEDIDYVLPFTKCLGLSHVAVMKSFDEE